MSRFAPDALKKRIIECFVDPDDPAYGQVSTISPDGVSFVRTVHIHYLSDRSSLAFNAHKQSVKWKHIKENGLVSGCYFDQKRGIQIRWRSKHNKLIHPVESTDEELLSQMWLATREEVRLAYWLYDLNVPLNQEDISQISINVEERAPSFVTVVSLPDHWDLYELNPRGYRFGCRTLLSFQNNEWKRETVSLLP